MTDALLFALIPALVFLLLAFTLWRNKEHPRRLSKNVFTEVSMPQIKPPPIYDVSHWKEIVDFSAVSPRPALFITKATEGTNFLDEKFIRFFDNAGAVGWRRGCYHFFRKALNPVQQAQHFCNTIRAHITNQDFLILDMEEGGETAAMLWAWFEEVKRQFPANKLMIYSRANLLNPIVMTTAEKTYFKQIPVWTAGYPYNPDPINTVPAGYIPDQTKWGPVWLWQYSDNGIVAGIQGSVDLNMATPVFLPLLDTPAPPPPAPAFDLQIDKVEMIVHATRLSDGTKWKASYTQAGLSLSFERDE